MELGSTRPGASYLVRETFVAGDRRIRVQNLRTGEMVEFGSWAGFVRYVKSQSRLGTLR